MIAESLLYNRNGILSYVKKQQKNRLNKMFLRPNKTKSQYGKERFSHLRKIGFGNFCHITLLSRFVVSYSTLGAPKPRSKSTKNLSYAWLGQTTATTTKTVNTKIHMHVILDKKRHTEFSGKFVSSVMAVLFGEPL